ncbi:FAD/FMN-dependent dehydrogenase (plasmid) [Salipiger profundus]|jgi:FAD/FMN-containing dehydrogenase/Fe-S oxidoreductase|uniref:FAD/FMN-dependent dehydrogenase n=1 Tax=Salipiger profundus TaxID=1229727 RepID=A0A1U7DC93_9RHOB|nr:MULTISPECIES: FAD-binding and (Fe-S)-binding domain-containing protein [Salipiger]APX25759.1 FAD/FMN-dependent dehydrogenase [Salipiger profundus]SFC84418.1 FAD/FMN-containing dehydrogenase [Salipiger profundus]
MTAPQPDFTSALSGLPAALRAAGFRGDVERDSALRAAMSTDNSVYRILPDLVVAPVDAADVVTVMAVLEEDRFAGIPVTPRGGGTGTNGQSLNRGVILDMRRHMTRLLAVDPAGQWADVEPGIVLDDLNAQLRPRGLFFAPETSTSTRCAVGGMVSTDASGKGSRIYGKTSDNLLGVEIARGQGLVSSLDPAPDWAAPMLAGAERAARAGRAAFVANTPKLNRRYTGYDLERACPEEGGFEWWRLFPGSEGTLGPITRIRVKLRPLPGVKRLVVAGFASFRDSLAAALPLMQDDPTAIEVMDERVQALAGEAGLLMRLPEALRPTGGEAVAYTFVEFNGDDPAELDARLAACEARLRDLPGIRAVHVAPDPDEIRELWAIRSAGVGLLGKVEGRARPVAFVEDCVVPPEELPAFLDGFLDILTKAGLGFGIYGHVDVGCLHIRPALDIDAERDRETLVAVSDAIFALVNRHGGIFWGEHGKGVRGAYLEGWIGPEAYAALQGVKAAFDPSGRFNPGKLVSVDAPVMGIATTPFRPFNAPEGDPLEKAFRCNGNAQCLSYAASVPMCPSFKATADLRQSPKGRADALRAWHEDRRHGTQEVDEADLLGTLDTCLGCKACASSCPVQVDIPSMRAAFFADYYARHARPLTDRAMLLAERLSPWLQRAAPLMRPAWPLARRIAERVLGVTDLPSEIARPLPRAARIAPGDLRDAALPERTVLVWMDWFSALYDGATQRDVRRGLTALGYRPLFVDMRPAGKVAGDLGDRKGFRRMAEALAASLREAAARKVPMIGLDPAFVMALRQDYRKAGLDVPEVLLPQEFLAAELRRGAVFPQAGGGALTLFTHCTESTGAPAARSDWQEVFAGLGLSIETPATGCCGMAGMFGHKDRHQEMSRRLFEMSWAAPLAGAEDAAATGFSCRCQGARHGGRPMRHPLGLLADRLGA